MSQNGHLHPAVMSEPINNHDESLDLNLNADCTRFSLKADDSERETGR